MSLIAFASTTIKCGAQTGTPAYSSVSVGFPVRVLSAEVCVKGWRVSFVGDNREVKEVLFDAVVTGASGNDVHVQARTGIRNNDGGSFKYEYEGELDVLVIAQLE